MIRKLKTERRVDSLVFDTQFQWPLLGIDEVGTGCIAGPIAMAGVVLSDSESARQALQAAGLKDSKQMTRAGRDRLYDLIREHSQFIHVAFMGSDDVALYEQGVALDKLFDSIVYQFREAVPSGGTVLLDGNPRSRVSWAHTAVQKADQKSLTVAAASVLAKVERDRLMEELALEFPKYGFEEHKGYPTPAHITALEKYGVSSIHRRNTRPVQEALSRAGQSPDAASETAPPLSERQ